MSQQQISVSTFTSDLLDHVIMQRQPLPKGFAGMLEAEIDCYNYYLAQPLENRQFARSQLGQDLWVAFLLDCWNLDSPLHRQGYFVEFGAFDGVHLSNSYLFEKQFGWQGIVAEPAPDQFAKCVQRRFCHIDPRCVWGRSGDVVSFNQVPGNEELATADICSNADLHGQARAAQKSLIQVQTVSLNDLLREWDAPRVIDYISIDTEGSEHEILKAFDFGAHAFRTLTVEHNFTDKREPIHQLLSAAGYVRVGRSVERFDDLYVKPELLGR